VDRVLRRCKRPLVGYWMMVLGTVDKLGDLFWWYLLLPWTLVVLYAGERISLCVLLHSLVILNLHWFLPRFLSNFQIPFNFLFSFSHHFRTLFFLHSRTTSFFLCFSELSFLSLSHSFLLFCMGLTPTCSFTLAAC